MRVRGIAIECSSQGTDQSYLRHVLGEIREKGFHHSCAVDLGCGPSMRDARILRGIGFDFCIGVDIQCKPGTSELGDGIDYVCADIDHFSLPLANESVDLILCDNVIEHLYYPGEALQECRRVLRTEGLLAILTPNQATLENRLRLILGGSIYHPLECWLGSGPEQVYRNGRRVFAGHIREYTISELEKMLNQVGFEVESKGILPIVRVPSPAGSLSQSRLAFSLYNLAERAFPNLAYMISIVAEKRKGV